MSPCERSEACPRRLLSTLTVLGAWLLAAGAHATGGADERSGTAGPPAAARIVTVVGGGGVGDGGPATEARLSLPGGVLVEPEGSLIVVDFGNHRIRRVDAESGTVTTIAGTGEPGFAGDGGPASEAQLSRPEYAAFSPAGDLYVVDSHNHRIRRIDRETGIIDTVVGTGARGSGGDGGPALEAQLNQPEGIAFDAAGNFYIGDTLSSRIRRVDAASGIITTVAGHGEVGLSGDGVPGPEAKFMRLARLAVAPNGDVVIADSPSHRIQYLDAETGLLETLAGTGVSGYSGDGGPAADALLSYPEGPIVDGEGNVYFADLGNHVVRRIDARSGTITTVAGTGARGFSGDGGPATSARLWSPGRLALDGGGNLYIADIANARVRRVSSDTGIIETVVGSGSLGDGGPGRDGQLAIPGDLAFHGGTLYIAEFGNRRVRSYRLDTGRLATVAGGGTGRDGAVAATELEIKLPEGIAVGGDGEVYVADSVAHRVWRVDPESDRVEAFAGIGQAGYSGDGGAASKARLNHPGGVAVTPDGTVWIADYGNRCLRAVDPATGVIRTVRSDPPELTLLPIVSLTEHRGSLYWVASGDDGVYRLDPGTGKARRMPVRLPCCRGDTDELQIADLTFAGDGRLYLADTLAHRILRVDLESGEAVVVAGSHDRPGFAGDDGPAAEASLFRPGALVAGRPGELFVADTFNHRIRRLDTLEAVQPEHTTTADEPVTTPFGLVSTARLTNGLTTIVVERPGLELAAVNLTVAVGSLQDPPGSSGMAHLLEHVSLTGTLRVGSLDPSAEAAALDQADRDLLEIQSATRTGIGPQRLAELRDRLSRSLAGARALAEPGEPYGRRLEARGAIGLNATTTADVTQFFCRLPTLEIGRWIEDEADRLRNPLLRNFYQERSVVVQEVQAGDGFEPFDALWHLIWPAAPAAASVSGQVQVILGIDRPAALAYLRSTYLPENVTITVVGDVEAERIFALIERTFGDWRPARPAAGAPEAAAPARQDEPLSRPRNLLVPQGDSPLLLVGFPAPPSTSDDAVALTVWQELLSSDDLSPLYAELVERRGVAVGLGFSARYPGLGEPAIAALQVQGAPGVGSEILAAAVSDALLALSDTDDARLRSAILLARTRLARSLDDPGPLAAALGTHHAVYGHWSALRDRLQLLATLTPDDLRAAAARHLVPAAIDEPER